MLEIILKTVKNSFRKYRCIFSVVFVGYFSQGCAPVDVSTIDPSTVKSFDENSEDDDTLNGSSDLEGEASTSQDIYDNTGLDNVTADLDGSFCDDASEEFQNVPGAASYFTGIYTSTSGNVTEQDTWFGIEEWILIPNSTWQEIQSETCYVVWDTVAVRTEIETCLGCTLAIEVTGSINLDATTCPTEIWNYPEFTSWQEDYEIALVGEISMFYYQSGSFLGMGTTNENAFNFL